MTTRQSITRRGTARDAGRAGQQHAGQPAPRWPAVILRVTGAGLLITTAAIHLGLYLTGYRTIPTIGWLFLLQVIAAFGLGLAVLAIPRRHLTVEPASGRGRSRLRPRYPRRLPAVGLDRAVRVQRGPHRRRHRRRPGGNSRVRGTGRAHARARPADGRSGPRGHGPGPVPRPDPAGRRPGRRHRRRRPDGGRTGAVRAGRRRGQHPATRSHGTGTGTALKTTTIGGTTVLTNANGRTLYSFAPDTPATSNCYGSCAAYWPPVTGTTTAGHGLPGTVTTITRTDGSHQLTYNGHPLYTYIGDSAPGQARGNNLNLNGGLWHEVPASR